MTTWIFRWRHAPFILKFLFYCFPSPIYVFLNWFNCHEISSVVIKFHTTHIPGLTRVPNIPSKLESSSRFINLVMERANACVRSQWKSRKAPISLSALLFFFPYSAMKSVVIKFVLNYSLSFCFAFGFFPFMDFFFIEISPTHVNTLKLLLNHKSIHFLI